MFNYIESLPKLGSFNDRAKGCFDYMCQLSYIKENPTKVKEGTGLFKISADNGYVDSMGEYSISLKNGKGVEIDYEEAIKYYTKGI